MGLSERRAAKEFEDTQFPALRDEIVKHAGFPVPIVVDWAQLAVDDSAHLYKECWPEVYFKPVIAALEQIGRDDMGREAIKATLKTIEVRNSKGASNPRAAITFENGVLAIDHKPCTNVGDTKDRTKYLVEVIEKAL